MKKMILIALLILVATLLSASGPVPTTQQRLSGTLLWTHNSVCMLPDFVALPVMENVYLRGAGFPSQGQFQGCQVDALGSYSKIGSCKIFNVSSASITCSPAITISTPR